MTQVTQTEGRIGDSLTNTQFMNIHNLIADFSVIMRSKNVKTFKDEEIALMNEFLNLGEEHMESKSLTLLNKLFDRAVLKLADEHFVQSENVAFGFSLANFRTSAFQYDMRRFLDTEYEYFKFKYKEKTEKDQIAINMLNHMSKDMGLTDLADRYFYIKNYQYMLNGKIPKSLVKEQTVKEVIKGKLHVEFQEIIEKFANELEAKETKLWAKTKENGVKIPYVTYDPVGEYFYDESVIDKNIAYQIDYAVKVFVYRLCDKLGGIKPKFSVTDTYSNISDERKFELFIKFSDNSQFTLRGSKVWNTSPLGTPFIQYPITFHDIMVEGKRVDNSEVNFKKAFKI